MRLALAATCGGLATELLDERFGVISDRFEVPWMVTVMNEPGT